MNTATLTIPNLQVELAVEQPITAARQLPAGDRVKLAYALVESDLEVELTQLIAGLYSQPPVDEISD
ncbi:MAG: hypothetical protein IPL28_11655, partial [Chloroflexi bacterium]|nr:hypothetical protein [Chloroflexota bacterium]